MKKKEKWGSVQYRQANNTYSAEIKIESRAHYAPEPARGWYRYVAMVRRTGMCVFGLTQ